MLQASDPSYDRVLNCCKEAIERVPENVKAHYRCGVALFYLCRYDDAVASLQKAAQLHGKTGAYNDSCKLKLSSAYVHRNNCSSLVV